MLRGGLPLAVAVVREEAERVQKLRDSEGGPEADTKEGQEQEPHGVTRDPSVDTPGFTSGLMGRSVYELTRTERYTGTDRAWPESWVGGGGEVSCGRRMGTWRKSGVGKYILLDE